MEGEDLVDIAVGDEQGVIDHVDEFEAAEQEEDQLKEEYYDEGVELVGDDVIELEGEEEPYEIKDEEYVEENVEDLDKEIGTTEGEKLGEADKNDGMLVVDEWDNHDVDSLSNEEDQLKTEDGKELIDPEESEKLLLHMPPLKTIMGDLLHLRRNRRVSVYPVTFADLQLPIIQKYLESDTCEEVKMQFIRPTEDIKTWSGFLSLTFVMSKNASQAVESLKSIREDLTVKVDANPEASLDTFIKNGKKSQASPAFWADRLLIVRNISADCKPDDLRAVFTEAEEIVVAKDSTTPTFRKRRGGSALGYAYVLYETPEAAKAAASTLMAEHVEYNNVFLDVQLYREPVTEVPRALLYLRRRRLILRHLEKLVRNVDKAQSDPEYKLAPSTESRIALCKTIIEKDDKARQELNLPAPTYEDFKAIKGFRPYSQQDAERVLISLGIIAKPPKPDDSATPSGRRDRPNNRRPQKPRGGQVDNRGGRGDRGRGGRGNFRRGGSPPRDRRSPPGSRRRNDWGGPGSDSRRGGYAGQNRNGNQRQGMNRQPGGGLGMMNPLAMMVQQNLGGLLGAGGLVNPAALNGPISMLMQQPGVGNLLGGAGPMSMMNPMGGGNVEPPPKMMRLDETGNLRVRREREERDFGSGMRDERGMLRDNRGRQRSRSPDYHMGQMRNQRGGMRGGPPHQQRSGFNELDRLGHPNRGYEPSGSGPPRGGEDDLSLLMNLSKMLSHKMEQKRHQAEHGYH